MVERKLNQPPTVEGLNHININTLVPIAIKEVLFSMFPGTNYITKMFVILILFSSFVALKEKHLQLQFGNYLSTMSTFFSTVH